MPFIYRKAYETTKTGPNNASVPPSTTKRAPPHLDTFHVSSFLFILCSTNYFKKMDYMWSATATTNTHYQYQRPDKQRNNRGSRCMCVSSPGLVCMYILFFFVPYWFTNRMRVRTGTTPWPGISGCRDDYDGSYNRTQAPNTDSGNGDVMGQQV